MTKKAHKHNNIESKSLPYPYYFVLEITNKCNLGCKYCRANPSPPEKHMDFKTMKMAIDKILMLPNKYATFLFHGGEPLLNLPIIEKAIYYTKRRAKNKKIKFSIQTNGTLLNQEIINFFKEHNIHIGISLDGPQEIHNRNRIYPNGKGSFGQVIKAINLLKKNNLSFGVIAVITRPKDVKKLYSFLVAYKIKYIRLNYYYTQNTQSKEKLMSSQKQKEFANEHFRLFKKIVDYNKDSSSKIILGNIHFMLHTLLAKKTIYMCMRAPCGAGNSTLGINVNGDIYPCDRMKDKIEFKIGNIKEDKSLREIILNSPILKKLKSRIPENIPKCRACAFKNFCSSGCVNNSYAYFGSLHRESDFCQYYKTLYPALVKLASQRRDEVYSYLHQYKNHG